MFIGPNIKKFRKSRGISQGGLARKANVSNDYMNRIELNKVSNIGLDVIEAIAKALGVQPIEILCGQKLAINQANSNNFIAHDDPAVESLKIRGYRLVPIIGKSAFDNDFDLSNLEEYSEEYAPAFTKDSKAFFARAEGEHMIGEEIAERDLLLVEPNKDISNGALVLAIERSRCSVKRYYLTDSKVILMPLNPHSKPTIIELEEIRYYRISAKMTKL